jgi:hypothetical protein
MYGVRLAFRRAVAVVVAAALGVVEVVVGNSEGSLGWRNLVLRFWPGRGLATRGVGGLETGFTGEIIAVTAASAGGVGSGAAAGTCLTCSSEARESTRGRLTREVTEDVTIVGEEACWRLEGARSLWLTCILRVPPGEGSGGTWPVLRTDIARS